MFNSPFDLSGTTFAIQLIRKNQLSLKNHLAFFKKQIAQSDSRPGFKRWSASIWLFSSVCAFCEHAGSLYKTSEALSSSMRPAGINI